MAFVPGQRVLSSAISLAVNPPIFTGYLTATQSIPNNAFTAVNIDTEQIDTHNGHSNTVNPSRYVCQVAGIYLLTGAVVLPTTATGTRGTAISLNGATTGILGSEQLIAPSPGFATTLAPTPTYQRLAVGDYVSLLAYQNSGSAMNTVNVGAAMNSFSAEWVSN